MGEGARAWEGRGSGSVHTSRCTNCSCQAYLCMQDVTLHKSPLLCSCLNLAFVFGLAVCMLHDLHTQVSKRSSNGLHRGAVNMHMSSFWSTVFH